MWMGTEEDGPGSELVDASVSRRVGGRAFPGIESTDIVSISVTVRDETASSARSPRSPLRSPPRSVGSGAPLRLVESTVGRLVRSFVRTRLVWLRSPTSLLRSRQRWPGTHVSSVRSLLRGRRRRVTDGVFTWGGVWWMATPSRSVATGGRARQVGVRSGVIVLSSRAAGPRSGETAAAAAVTMYRSGERAPCSRVVVARSARPPRDSRGSGIGSRDACRGHRRGRPGLRRSLESSGFAQSPAGTMRAYSVRMPSPFQVARRGPRPPRHPCRGQTPLVRGIV